LESAVTVAVSLAASAPENSATLLPCRKNWKVGVDRTWKTSRRAGSASPMSTFIITTFFLNFKARLSMTGSIILQGGQPSEEKSMTMGRPECSEWNFSAVLKSASLVRPPTRPRRWVSWSKAKPPPPVAAGLPGTLRTAT
jgi:hypothetical protein